MMKMKLLLVLLVAIALVAPTVQANMLKNPSFEDGAFAPDLPPDNWTVSETTGTSMRTWFDDATGAHWGSRYIKMNTWVGWLGTSAFIWQNVSVTEGQEYAFSVWAKCPVLGETSEAWAWVDWLDYTNGIISGDWLPLTLDVGSNWTHVDFGTLTAPAEANRAVYYLAGVPENVLMGILFDDACMNTPLPSFPSPAWEALVAIGNVDLSWTNLPPKAPATSVYVDVWFGPGTGPSELDPNAVWVYDMIKIVDAAEEVNSVTVVDLDPNMYYWRVDSYVYGDPAVEGYDINGTDPNLYPVIKGYVWSFDVVEDAPPSSVDVGSDMITWAGEPVNLDATVVDDGTSALTIAWSSDNPTGTNVLFSATDIEDPTVTITKESHAAAEIVNASFEDRLDGWDKVGGGHGTWTGVWGGKIHIYPTDGNYTAFVDGTQGDPVEGGWLSQTLTETLTVGTTYTLTVDVVNDGFYNEDVEYKVQLLAGETVIAEDNNEHDLPIPQGNDLGEWQTSTVVYTLGGPSDPNFAYVGLPLGIRLVAKVNTIEMNFDNVHLTADPPFPAPEVSTVELTIMVNDEANPTYVPKDTMTVDVYDTACLAAKAAEDYPADLDGDCVIGFKDLYLMAEDWLTGSDLVDFAVMAKTWLDDYALTEPAEKP